ncbi:hypothetical protein DFJ74DRAFT_669004 [Hyaloraphidium curvatum]|nr:hypothetical protein DFJ74DRAFT_669004 [Hyaloraphidium curvatum]
MGAAQYVELAPYYQAAAAERQGRYLAVHADAGRRHSSVDRAARPAGQGMRGALRAQAMSETASPQWKPAADAERGAGSPPKEVEVLELALPATAQGPSPASESSYADSAEGDPESSSSGASRTPSPPPERQGKSPKAGGKPRRTLLWTNSSVRASTDMVMGAEELFTPRAPGERDRDRDGKAGEERKGKPAANGKPKANGAPPGKPQANGSAAPAKPQANGSAAPAKPHANGSGAKLQANGTAAAPARAGAAAKHRAASFGNSFASLEAPSSQPAAPARGEPVVRAMSWAAVVAKPTSREAAEREE